MYIVHHPLAGIMNNKTKYMSLGIVQEKKKKEHRSLDLRAKYPCPKLETPF